MVGIKKTSDDNSSVINIRNILLILIAGIVLLFIFLQFQSQARDAVRKQEIQSISQSLEAHYLATAAEKNPIKCDSSDEIRKTSSYCPLQDKWFQKGLVPKDPQGGAYCIFFNNDPNESGFIKDLNADNWPGFLRNTCPVVSNSHWVEVADNVPNGEFRNFKICTRLESQDKIYCVGSQQR